MADYWAASKYLLADHPLVEKHLAKDKLIIVDGGAAGAVSAPFDAIESYCDIYRFEPRGENAVDVGGTKYVPGGLWSEPATLPLHVGKEPTTSSIYPPNMEYLSVFEPRIGVGARSTASKPDVPLTSVDTAVAKGQMPLPSFVKLDIHSAEYEAILGTEDSQDQCLGFLVETWHSDVHKGQFLHCDVERHLITKGYTVFANRYTCTWPHQFNGQVHKLDRPQLVGSEMLFMRLNVPPELAIKQVVLLDLFGFTTYAKQTLSNHRDALGISFTESLIAALEQHHRAREKDRLRTLRGFLGYIKRIPRYGFALQNHY